MKITAVIPLYNAAPYVAETIQSLLAQTYREVRIVCVDDASTDDSLAVARSFAGQGVEVLQNKERLGLAGNWNRAFALTETPYLVIAHQDDLYERDYLESVLRLIESAPRAFIAHTRATYIDERGVSIEQAAAHYKDRFWPPDEPYERDPRHELRVLQLGNYIICPSVIYRMSAARTVGPFNESLGFVTDWEYWMRGLAAGFTLTGTHKRLVRWRRHAGTATALQEVTLDRYREEIAHSEWIARHCGIPIRYDAVFNTILSDFASRLARGDRAGSAALRDYARQHLPQKRYALALMNAALAGGPAAGRLLRAAESLYARYGRPRVK